MSEIEWEKLREPFPPDELETVRKYGSVELTYVNANAVCRRLDDVCGAANWQTENRLLWDGENCPVVHCTLSIRVGEEWVSRDDFGYPNSIRREAGQHTRIVSGEEKPIRDLPPLVEDNEAIKSAATDALRRAAWRWGIGWELHEKTKSTTPASQERRSETPAGDTPLCGVKGCGGHGVVRKSGDGHEFWGCSNYRDTQCKGDFPKYHEEGEQESLGESEPPQDLAPPRGSRTPLPPQEMDHATADYMLEVARLTTGMTKAKQTILRKRAADAVGLTELPGSWEEFPADARRTVLNVLENPDAK